MPISNTSTNYSGRLKDVHVFQGVNPEKQASITPSFGRISNFCAGIQKLVQRYTISLLTELGSQPDFPDFGSTLLTRLKSRSMSLNRADLFPIFNIASAKIIREFRDYQANNTMPTDEQLNTVILNEVVLIGDYVSLRATLIPVSATPVEFIIPLPK